MSLNETVSAERVHIGFFGMRNAGKSSLVNAVTGQDLSVVSEVKGTTTDPVQKAMELLPLGPVVIIDTPGLDDEGELGSLRVKKARTAFEKTDIAVLVVDAEKGLSDADTALIKEFRLRALPYIIAYNKSDLTSIPTAADEHAIFVSAKTGYNIHALKERLGALGRNKTGSRVIVSDLLTAGDTVILVIPIDESAPKGRLILPQQQTMRDILDARCTFLACQPAELPGALSRLSQPPRLIITDSQAFGQVSAMTPANVPLTSFSILFARYKGELTALVQGAVGLSRLQDGDSVLIAEGCTHHRQCNDIGTVKLPGWIRSYTGKDVKFHFTSGGDFPEDLSGYKLIVHCGGCMLNEAAMRARMNRAAEAGIPIVNYGVVIAQMHGILRRSLEPFPEVQSLLF